MEARHLNRKRADNRLTNLTWGTKSQNEADRVAHGTVLKGMAHGRAKLSDDDVRAIRRLKGEVSSTVAAARFKVSQSLVVQIWRRVIWKHLD
jgi:hypothetical protein